MKASIESVEEKALSGKTHKLLQKLLPTVNPMRPTCPDDAMAEVLLDYICEMNMAWPNMTPTELEFHCLKLMGQLNAFSLRVRAKWKCEVERSKRRYGGHINEFVIASNELTPLEALVQKENRMNQPTPAKMLAILTEEYAKVVRLRYLEEFTLEEIAELIGKKPTNVRVILHRALQKIKDSFPDFADNYSTYSESSSKLHPLLEQQEFPKPDNEVKLYEE